MFKTLFVKAIKIYQYFVSPLLAANCRFYPSCSEYSAQSIEKYGVFHGIWKGARRIFKCHPWHLGGVDLP